MTVLAFGTFDRLHDGHRVFLERAALLGDRLVVAIARDDHVWTLKGKRPFQDEETRRLAVAELDLAHDVVLSDQELGTYAVIETVRPDVIAIGYDQSALATDSTRHLSKHGMSIPLIRVAHKEAHVALGVVERDGQFLIIQRKDKNPMWDRKWEFPGGKIDSGETPDGAVMREIIEETGLTPREAVLLGNHVHDWQMSDYVMRVHLSLFRCPVGEGDVKREERSSHDHAWVHPHDALTYDLLEANADLIKRFLL